jgi:CheY-like chemotaxis protein
MAHKLLLADDSITIQKVIQITFAHEDYQLTITDNGDTAFDRARQLVPDLILADIYMPGRSGYELCAAIKQTPALQHIPVLLLAGSFEPFDENKARAAGADGWIEKPFESQALIDKVAELLAAAMPRAAVASAAEAAPVAVAESAVAMAEPFADFSFEETSVAAAEPAEFVFEDLSGSEPNFEFSDEPFVVEAERTSTREAAPSLSAIPSEFDAGDEILPLEDEDILGGEDLEPVADMPTLTPWERRELPADEPFPAIAEGEESSAVDFEAVVASAPQEMAAPLVVPAAAGQQAQTLTELSQEELESIVERAVTRALEKLAGTVL